MDHVDGYTYRDLVASRISLSIRSTQDETVPLPQSRAIAAAAGEPADCRIAPGRSAAGRWQSENRAVPLGRRRDGRRRMAHQASHILEGRNWNDMAVIAHDNATVRTIGERLRHDGVPVRYSSVTRPLKDEPFVQGLFALLELAMLRNQTVPALGMNLQQTALYVRSRLPR